jgi:cyclopropane-fatty-acyl-phospholipid synthase
MQTLDAPTVPRSATPDPQVAAATEFLDCLFPAPRTFAIRLWEGTVLPGGDGARVTLALCTPGALRRMFRLPLEPALGAAYLAGDFDLEGDLWEIGPAFTAARAAALAPASALALVRAWRRLPRGGGRAAAEAPRMEAPEHTRAWDRAGIRYHYDAGNDFYQLFLDRRMVYSCGYFPTGAEGLDEAQEAKLEHVCRKLRLGPGMRLLDIGCGWGALAIHAATRFGVEVVGVTLSEQQAALARERVAAAGVEGRVRIELCDYRDLTGERFDRVSSIGMFEHVGRKRLPEYFDTVFALLRRGGLFLNHGIGGRARRPPPPVRGALRRALDRVLLDNAHFRRTYVFPNGDLVPVSEANLLAEQAGFEVRDVENLREHYGRTLRFWAERLEARREGGLRLGGTQVFRIWRLFMGIASWQFATGELAVYQSLLERPTGGPTEALPWSRADLYA